MKIFFIIPTLSHGGAERVISELANSLSQNGHNVSVVLWLGGNQFYQLDDKVKLIDFKLQHASKLDKIIGLLKVTYKLRKLYMQEKPDAVISFLTRTNIIAILSGLFLDTKIFISERNNPYLWDNNSQLILLLRNFTYKRATGFIAQTKTAQKLASQKFHIGSQVIANPIKSISLSPDIKKEKIILNIGRLHEQKGQKYLLEAFSKLNTREWKLVILGEGPERANLESLALTLEIQDYVDMPGSVNNIDEWLQKASIFAFPSMYEGFPNALLEAMGAGLPCISFDCDTGPRDLIRNNKNGILIPLKDVNTLTKALKGLINDEEKRDEIASEAKKVTNIYGVNNITKKLLNYINEEKICTKRKK
jgi:glycosyltransferase involved in cell wall biosynthesis